jgi:hypothetical protein
VIMRRLVVWCLGFCWIFCAALGGPVAWAALPAPPQVQVSPLQQRLAAFPHWQALPKLPPAQGDLIYPQWFAGDWQVTNTLVEQFAPLSPAITSPGFESNRRWLNQPVRFPVRFGHTSDGQVVADRVFNGLSLARAYLGEAVVRQIKLDPESVNRQVVLFRSACPESGDQAILQKNCDRQLVTLTQARQQDPATTPAEEWLTSELSQQQFRSPGAQVYFNQVENTTAYYHHPLDVATITAEQLTAIYLSPQDPDYFKAQNQPVALYRYRLEFYPRSAP